jgi:predicted aspartyl protease
MKCEIRVISGDFSITVPVVTASGCQEDLVLEPQDIQDLQLNLAESRRVGYADGSTGIAQLYGDVVIELTLTDGNVVRASVAPVLFEQTQNPDVVGVPTIPQRLLGFRALYKLNLKLDFRNNMLTKRIRRI